MRFVSRLFLYALLVLVSNGQAAFARQPEKAAERSLLYWRYLCQGEKQEESIQDGKRSFHCSSQGWAVRTPAESGEVKEIIDDAP